MAKNIPSNENQSPAPRLLYPMRLSIKMEGEIKSFPDRRKLKEYTSTKPALQDMLKGLLLEEEEKKAREGGTQLRRRKMNMNLSITTLNVNGLNMPKKKTG